MQRKIFIKILNGQYYPANLRKVEYIQPNIKNQGQSTVINRGKMSNIFEPFRIPKYEN